ncbi:hypothetical protein IWQ62_003933 [Dispira parvispora]|uniref:SAM domain-containing protein n=1 Tax=Dispira parvispora TaxID=1520584 RepID=A0A9W8ATX0_9FUNG|nr:hypothetical protein IWQ62_003933 [Dispira parvispora]
MLSIPPPIIVNSDDDIEIRSDVPSAGSATSCSIASTTPSRGPSVQAGPATAPPRSSSTLCNSARSLRFPRKFTKAPVRVPTRLGQSLLGTPRRVLYPESTTDKPYNVKVASVEGSPSSPHTTSPKFTPELYRQRRRMGLASPSGNPSSVFQATGAYEAADDAVAWLVQCGFTHCLKVLHHEDLTRFSTLKAVTFDMLRTAGLSIGTAVSLLGCLRERYPDEVKPIPTNGVNFQSLHWVDELVDHRLHELIDREENMSTLPSPLSGEIAIFPVTTTTPSGTSAGLVHYRRRLWETKINGDNDTACESGPAIAPDIGHTNRPEKYANETLEVDNPGWHSPSLDNVESQSQQAPSTGSTGYETTVETQGQSVVPRTSTDPPTTPQTHKRLREELVAAQNQVATHATKKYRYDFSGNNVPESPSFRFLRWRATSAQSVSRLKRHFDSTCTNSLPKAQSSIQPLNRMSKRHTINPHPSTFPVTSITHRGEMATPTFRRVIPEASTKPVTLQPRHTRYLSYVLGSGERLPRDAMNPTSAVASPWTTNSQSHTTLTPTRVTKDATSRLTQPLISAQSSSISNSKALGQDWKQYLLPNPPS